MPGKSRRPISETSIDLREKSFESLENRIIEELSHPLKKFNGLNHIRMFGRNSRLFMGENPKALLVTTALINIPATLFNAIVAPVPLWGDLRYLLVTLGVALPPLIIFELSRWPLFEDVNAVALTPSTPSFINVMLPSLSAW